MARLAAAMTSAADCKGCGKTIAPHRVAQYKGKSPTYCSRSCSSSNRQYKAAAIRVLKPCRACGLRRTWGKGSPFCSTEHRDQWRLAMWTVGQATCRVFQASGLRTPSRRELVCKGCAKAFVYITHKGKPPSFCSDECRGRKRAYSNAYEKQHGGSGHRGRARRAGVAFHNVRPRVIFMRDGWTCRMCGRPTPPWYRSTNAPCAPEIDHIIPISRGGPHIESNLQTACRDCNIKKGNDLGYTSSVPIQGPPGDSLDVLYTMGTDARNPY